MDWKKVIKSVRSEVAKFQQWKTGLYVLLCLSLCRRIKYAIKKTFVQKPCRDIAEIYLSIRSSIISFFSLNFKLFPQVSRVQNPELHTKAT